MSTPTSSSSSRPTVEVRQVDLTTDTLEPLHFDLVHCRLLLLHLADPMAALQKLADSVAPGGVLLVEEWDYATTQAYQARPSAVGGR